MSPAAARARSVQSVRRLAGALLVNIVHLLARAYERKMCHPSSFWPWV